MAVIRPFCALRPTPANAAAVAAVPYDVVSTEEARELASGNPLSFLHVSRAEIDLPDGTDQFGNHVDVNSHESARRFLVFFLYLDDNEKGNTSFPQHRIISECQKGSCLMFPPMWPWLHAGEKPINKPKYIVGSYLHYV